MNSVALIVNSHDSSEDLWPIFLGEFCRFGWNLFFRQIYFFSSRIPAQKPRIPCGVDFEILTYDAQLPYNLQYLSCIKRVPHELVVIANEDCIPCGEPNIDELIRVTNLMSSINCDTDFIKFVRGEEGLNPTQFESLYEIDPMSKMFFTQQVSIWRRKTLSMIYAMCPNSYIARKGGIQQEELGSDVCRTHGIKGKLYYTCEPKRGLYHYDCSILPHICTAIVGGLWNCHEYKHEIDTLVSTYSLELDKRGIYAGY